LQGEEFPVIAPADEGTVHCPIWKSPKVVMPVACVLVEERVPIAGADQLEARYFFTRK
jgi:hypothetical protein